MPENVTSARACGYCGAERRRPCPVRPGAALLLALLIVPVFALVRRDGLHGLRLLGADRELRAALWLSALAATAATLVTVVLNTPLAYLMARGRLLGAPVVSALLDCKCSSCAKRCMWAPRSSRATRKCGRKVCG